MKPSEFLKKKGVYVRGIDEKFIDKAEYEELERLRKMEEDAVGRLMKKQIKDVNKLKDSIPKADVLKIIDETVKAYFCKYTLRKYPKLVKVKYSLLKELKEKLKSVA